MIFDTIRKNAFYCALGLSFALHSSPPLLDATIFNVNNTTGFSGNVEAVAQYIINNYTSSLDPTYVTQLTTLTGASLQDALNQLHPALFEAIPFTAADTTYLVSRTFNDRLRMMRQANVDTCEFRARHAGMWVAGAANNVKQNMIDQLIAFSTKSEVLSFGIDNYLCDSVLVGFGAGYTHSSLKWSGHRGHDNINGFDMGVYATKFTDFGYLDASLLLFMNQNQVTRNIKFAAIDRKAKSTHFFFGLNPHIGAGITFDVATVEFTPFINMDYYAVIQNKMTEKGAKSLDLDVKRNHTNLARLELGINIAQRYEFCNGVLIPNVSFSCVNHQVLSGQKYVSSFEGLDSTFVTEGAKIGFNEFDFCIGTTYIFNRKLAVNVLYEVEFGTVRKENTFLVEVNHNF